MPDKCNSSLCLHGFSCCRDEKHGSFEYVETDPSGRYGRYKEVLGKGAFKTVYRAFDQEEGIEVAWHQLWVEEFIQVSDDICRLCSALDLLKTLKHKNIIKFFYSWVDKNENNVNFITEIFTSGTLRQYRKRHKNFDIKAVKNWSRQILRGLHYLHSHDPPIIHQNLKSDNVLINGNQGEVKIGDLGLVTILQHAYGARSFIGTPEFMAPELYDEEHTELVDIYSFGMCLLEMVTSEYPYSECSNAAQIYKRVTAGRKPEALKKVQDLNARLFIEKCIAPVCDRLPAWELLMDPFLQSDENMGPLFPPIRSLLCKANDLEEPHGKSTTVHISYKLKEMLQNSTDDNSNCCDALPPNLNVGLNINHSGNMIFCKPPPSQLREERARHLNFLVNGSRREDDMVFLSLQITDSEGQVRNVHFPFDVESDTAMCVASEMVTELDLTDHDVTKIAEMIDAAVLALIPEWSPGVAINEGCGDEGEADQATTPKVLEDNHARVMGAFSPLALSLSEGPSQAQCCAVAAALEISSPALEGTVYGRFQEVTFHCHRSDFHFAEKVDEQCSDSSNTFNKGEWDLTEGSKSPNDAVALSEETSTNNDVRAIIESFELKKEFDEIRRQSPCVEVGLKHLEPHNNNVSGEASVSLHLGFLADAYRNESVYRELSELTLRQQQELQELQLKHKEALADVRNRHWLRKRVNCTE